MPLGDQARRVQALVGAVSHSRAKFCWVSEHQSQLEWHTPGTSTSRGHTRITAEHPEIQSTNS